MLNKMIFCSTIIDLSFDVFDYKKNTRKQKKKKKEAKKTRIELEHAKRTQNMNTFYLKKKVIKIIYFILFFKKS